MAGQSIATSNKAGERDLDPRATKLVTGSAEPDLAMRLLEQVVDALWLPSDVTGKEREARMSSAMMMLRGVKPEDELEGMLATQMVATHNAAMDCFRRAMASDQSSAARELNLGLAAKLLTIGVRQVEALDRHRGRGQQKLTVEHVDWRDRRQPVISDEQAAQLARDRAAELIASGSEIAELLSRAAAKQNPARDA